MQMIEHAMISGEVPEFAPVVVNGTPLDEQRIVQEIQYYPAESLEISRAQAAQALVVRELLDRKSVV